ncbi:phosphatase PAP2 family protein [Nocardia iowensis]|uniref:phosphatase PAP2 family protein n=1 Tax=Nocardia iowensis TaxID=204891 RepID=UPI001FE3C6DC|nr:phosphatase PAP2 family protein [Nocardia iowensis]
MFGLRQDVIPGGAFRLGGIALGGAVAGLLPATFPPDGGPTALDRALAAPIHSALDSRPGIYQALVIPSNAYILLPLLLLACTWFGYRGDWRRAAIMLVVPELALGLNTWLWKPLWNRQLHDYLAYPSGHTVHLIAIATAFIVLVDSMRARITALVVAVAAQCAAAIGMIGLDYHLPTDILGGVAAAVAMVLALCSAALSLTGGARQTLVPTKERW